MRQTIVKKHAYLFNQWTLISGKIGKMKFNSKLLLIAVSLVGVVPAWSYQVTEVSVPPEAQVLYEDLKDRAKDCLLRAQSPEESHICRTQMLTEKSEIDKQFGLLAPVGKPLPQTKVRAKASAQKPKAARTAAAKGLSKSAVKPVAKASSRAATKPPVKRSGANAASRASASRR